MQLRTNYPSSSTGREIDYARIKANAFSDQGIVVANVNDQRLDAFERQFLQNLGEKLYGRKAA